MARTKKPAQVPGENAIEDEPTLEAAETIDDGTPAADDVDPSRLQKSILTRDGWVCPLRYEQKA